MARPVVLIASALLAGSLAVVLVARGVGLGSARPSGPRVVVAATAIEAGLPLQAQQLRTHAWPTQAPAGAFEASESLVGRVLRQPLVAGEPVLEARLAPVDGRGGLSATLAEGKRAITVRGRCAMPRPESSARALATCNLVALSSPSAMSSFRAAGRSAPSAGGGVAVPAFPSAQRRASP